ncbi:MAG: hypothetical protein HOW73_12435 [Polyangiaceae bacterium]|nr:hypothetical protein [Polyangiaceae bacterium]
MLGPAAYLADSLELLDRHPKVSGGGSARDVLFARRPDIQRIALSCKNAETALPYVDLVNELLEVRLATAVWPSMPVRVDTTLTTDELVAHPEIIYPTEHVAAYTALESAVYPFRLPFHFWQEEARVYLEHLGVPRKDLIVALAPTVAGLNAGQLALERLGTTARQFDIIAAPAAPPNLNDHWGVASTASLSQAKVLMEKAGMSFEELRELLATRYASQHNIGFASNATCDLDTLQLTGLGTTEVQQFLHRFLRLRQVLGWSISDTDKVHTTFGVLNDSTLRSISDVRELQRRFGVTPPEVLAWFDDVDREGDWSASLFERVFLDKRVAAPADAIFQLIFQTGTSAATLGGVRPGLLSALRIKPRDLDLLIDAATANDALAINPPRAAADVADVKYLSQLYRIASFTQKLKISIEDYLSLRALTGAKALSGDDDSPVGPAETLSFLNLRDRLATSPLSLPEAQYVLRHVASPDSSFMPSEEEIVAWRTELEEAVATVAESAEGVQDPDGDLLDSLAKKLFDTTAAGQVRALVVSPDTFVNAEAFIEGTIAPFIGGDLAADDAVNKIAKPETRLDLGGRFAYLASRFQRHLDAAAAIASFIAQKFGIEPEIASRLVDRSRADAPVELDALLKWNGGPAVAAFIPGAEWKAPQATEVQRRELLIRIQKSCLVLSRLGFTGAELARIYPGGWHAPIATSALPRLDFDTLPVERATPATALAPARAQFANLLRLGELAALRDRYKAGRAALFDLVWAARTDSPTIVLERLATDMGWDEKDVTALGNRLEIDAFASFADEHAYLVMEKAMSVVTRLGVPATQVIGWADVAAALPPNMTSAGPNAFTIAREIKRAARAKHDDKRWAEVARPLRNAIREKQRDALVGRLVHNLSLKDADALYENLLVDVQMDPCMLTSRLVLAHGTVQHFTQRVLFNLEQPALEPREDTAQEWQWMKNYRVWEANRKVFLWPENWIEPDLRDDKTPLFEELERALLSGPLENREIENAYRAYLDGLADVANLEIVAMHSDAEVTGSGASGSTRKPIHVFGRTAAPYRYFHRKRELGQWSPWKKVDLDIQGDHLMPFMFGGRLYLAWAQMEEVEKKVIIDAQVDSDSGEDVQEKLHALLQEQAQAAEADDFERMIEIAEEMAQLQQPATAVPAAAEPPKYELKVKVAVSELRGDVWTPATLSEAVLLGAAPHRHRLALTSDVVGQGTVRVCLIYGDAICAVYDYSPSRNTITQSAVTELDGTIGNFEIGILPVPVGTDYPKAPPHGPQGMTAWFQGFKRSQKDLRLFLHENGSPNATAIVLKNGTKDYRKLITTRVTNDETDPQHEWTHVVLQDRKRSFFMELRTEGYSVDGSSGGSLDHFSSYIYAESLGDRVYRFTPFSHPYIDSFRQAIVASGIEGLLRPADQTDPLQYQFANLTTQYQPNDEHADFPNPASIVDFEHRGPYGVYNWELFFHAPFLIATRLGQDGRYEEAMRWFHFIFDPTDGKAGTDARRYWKFRPFAENPDLATIQSQLQDLAEVGLNDGEGTSSAAEDLADQIDGWRSNPFEPHLLARMRPIAYQKAVVMRYIDNLIAWADALFSRDTIESINEATQLYVLASNVLGPRPVLIPEPLPTPDQSYAELDTANGFDAFSNSLVETEILVPNPPRGINPRCAFGRPAPAVVWRSLYFCIPPNEKLLGYWDTIADRLFKIRNCQNIEGVTRTLPLFEPPIDPALLVRAVAAGLDLSSVLFDINVAAPPYRYGVLFGKAVELASSVASLGGSYLSALEKLDAESLSNLRQRHEIAIQEVVRETRKAQVREAKESLRSVERSLTLAQERLDFYSSRERVNAAEGRALMVTKDLQDDQEKAARLKEAAGQAANIPNFVTGVSGAMASPVSTIGVGGSLISAGLNLSAAVMSENAARKSAQASTISTQASYGRRKDDWDLQARLAQREIRQIESQIIAAQIRLEIAENELATTERQLAQSREVEQFLKRKFTNEELYGWMKGQLASTYYQAYKLAFEVAKRAQAAFQDERGDVSQSFITFGYWDGLKKGLLAGEKLLHDLRRMDAAYTAQNKRELELVKMVSLAEHDPDQLLRLRETGSAELSLTEDDYDRDFKDHYMRRFKSVAVTVPCKVGPYQGVHGTLEVLHGSTRAKFDALDLSPSLQAIQSIATSHAQQDVGMFELNFRDERLLPFEGVGAHANPDVSGPQIRFALSGGNKFAYDSIDDVVLDIRYTARAGRTEGLPGANATRTLKRLIRVPNERAEAWTALIEGASALTFEVPFDTWQHGRKEAPDTTTKVRVYTRGGSGTGITLGETTQSTPTAMGAYQQWEFTGADAERALSAAANDDWTFGFASWTTKPTDVWVVFEYEVEVQVTP